MDNENETSATASKSPLISVVTPVFNCAKYLRQCLESVRDQGYANYEHIVVDGASKDGTVEILKEYPDVRWISEPDRGEAEALNKALRLARGEIIGWLNGDDYYHAGVLPRVASEIEPKQGRCVVYGNTEFIDDDDRLLFLRKPAAELTLPVLVRFWRGLALPRQPSIFYSRRVFEEVGPFREDLHYGIDYDHWLRTTLKYGWHYVDQTFSTARIQADCKSARNVGEQFRTLEELAAPYLRALPDAQQREIRRDYLWRHQVVRRVNDLRSVLQLGPRYRALKRALTSRPARG